MIAWQLLLVLLVGVAALEEGSPVTSNPVPLAAARFCPNQGQWPEHVEWVARHNGIVLSIEENAFGVQVRDGERGHFIRFVIEGGVRGSEAVGVGLLPGVSNYLLGQQATRGVPGFAQVCKVGVRPGVDVVFGLREGNLAYDLDVAHARDLEDVRIRVEGADGLRLSANGALVIETSCGEVRQLAPVVYLGPEAQRIECRYQLDGDLFRFVLPDLARDRRSEPLLVDPSLVWSTYLGGTGLDVVHSIDTRPDGTILVAGVSQSSSFPTTPGAFQEQDLPGQDSFVSVISPDGGSLIFSTYIGGNDSENDAQASARPDGGAVVIASTKSSDHPVHPTGYDITHNGEFDIVVLGLNSAGDTLDMGTFVGSAGRETAGSFIVDADGTILVAGRNCDFASTFPTTPGAYQTEIPWTSGICNGVVFRLSAAGTSLLASTLLGGGADEWPEAIMSLPDGEIIVAGFTMSTDYPTTPGSLQESALPTANQGFVTRLTADLSTAVASTFVPLSIANATLDDSGGVVVGGNVNQGMEVAFAPDANAWSDDAEGGHLAGIGILEPSLDSWRALSYVPRSPALAVADMDVDPWGVLLTMKASTGGIPTTPDAVVTLPADHGIGYLARLDHDLTRMLYGTYFGGVQAGFNGGAFAVEAIGNGDAIVAGALDNMQTTPGAFQPVGNGTQTGFVTRLRTAPPWDVTSAGLVGEAGVPILVGHGWPSAGELVGVTLTKARANGTATWVLGASQLAAPFKGGVLDPSPDLLIPGLPISAEGELTVTFTWPPGVPIGFTTWHQLWVVDPIGPAGFASTNGLVVVSD